MGSLPIIDASSLLVFCNSDCNEESAEEATAFDAAEDALPPSCFRPLCFLIPNIDENAALMLLRVALAS